VLFEEKTVIPNYVFIPTQGNSCGKIPLAYNPDCQQLRLPTTFCQQLRLSTSPIANRTIIAHLQAIIAPFKN